jgi:single-strand DNA-binding protein
MSDLRMPDLNKVILAGRLTRDPELSYLPSGTPLCKMGLAVSRFYKTQDGERKEDVTFLQVTAWNKLAEFCGQYLKKGRPVLIEGSLRSNEWEDKATGQKRSMIEVTARSVQQLDWEDRGGSGGGGGAAGSSQREPVGAPQQRQPAYEEPPPEDDIPF